MNTLVLPSSSENATERFQQLGKDLMLYVIDGDARRGGEKISWIAPPKKDKEFSAGCQALENAWLSAIQSLHASLLDQRLNELVSEAEKTLANRDAALRLRFYKELDIRRKVRPDFLFPAAIQSNFIANDSYIQSFMNVGVAGGVAGGIAALLLSKAIPFAFPVALFGILYSLHAQKQKYVEGKLRVRNQLAADVSRLMTHAAQKSEVLLQQAEQRFDEVFAEFLAN